MAFAFKFPDVGEGIHEGEIVKWLVKEGDFVKEDQPLVEMQTDKAVVEIPSPKSGKILKLNFKDGDTVNVGEVLVLIEEKLLGKSLAKEDKGAVVGQLDEETSGKKDAEKITIRQTSDKNLVTNDSILATPKIRALANKLSVNISQVKGSGKNGIITEDDVINSSKGKTTFASQPKNSGIKVTKKYDFYGYVDRVALRGVRKTIAEHMTKSYSTIPHVTHMDFVDVTNLSEIIEK